MIVLIPFNRAAIPKHYIFNEKSKIGQWYCNGTSGPQSGDFEQRSLTPGSGGALGMLNIFHQANTRKESAKYTMAQPLLLIWKFFMHTPLQLSHTCRQQVILILGHDIGAVQ